VHHGAQLLPADEQHRVSVVGGGGGGDGGVVQDETVSYGPSATWYVCVVGPGKEREGRERRKEGGGRREGRGGRGRSYAIVVVVCVTQEVSQVAVRGGEGARRR
jgi:hypothetical protein